MRSAVIALSPLRVLANLLLVLLLAGCGTAHTAGRKPHYVEPAAGPDTAEIHGDHRIGISISGYRAFPSTIDGQRIENAADWRIPHRIPAGPHTIGIEYDHLGSRGTYEHVVEIKAGHRYRTAFTAKNGYHFVLDEVKLWLQDETESQSIAVFFDGEMGNPQHTLFSPQ